MRVVDGCSSRDAGAPRAWRRRAAGLGLLALSACTALSDFGVRQCETSADCDTLSGEILRCDDARCVPGCENNHHCAAFDPRAPICPAKGAECVSLTSDDGCYLSSVYDDELMGERVASELAILGVFASALPPSTWLTLELAATELNSAALGAPELPPVVVVLCDGARDSVADSMEHLAVQLGSRAVIASLEENALQIVRGRPDLAHLALLLSPHAASAAPAGDGAELVWYLGGRYDEASALYPSLIRGVQSSVETASALPPSFRLAVLASAASEDAALSRAVIDAIDWNGRNADYLFREDRFRQFTLSDVSPSERAATVSSLVRFAPDLILVFAGGDVAAPSGEPRLAMLEAIEAQASEAWAPDYILGPRAVEDETVARLVAASDSFRARAIGVSADRAADPALEAALRGRFEAAYPQASASGKGPSFNVYDAAYYLTYATAAARAASRVPSASAILDGLARVVDFRREAIDVGPDGVLASLQRIAARESFQLRGITGPARFTPDHARAGQAGLVCWARDPRSGAVSLRAASEPYLDDPLLDDPSLDCARDFGAPRGAP